uniref:Uncharacterized protein n=1 Tax=Rhizophora mucronata TaxID=61149 RepID=A0A2P2MSM8_RHIMU
MKHILNACHILACLKIIYESFYIRCSNALPKTHFTEAQQQKTNFTYFFFVRSLCNNLFRNRVQKGPASNSRSRFSIIPIEMTGYVNNMWDLTNTFEQPWIIIKLLDKEHVQFTLHLICCVQPDERIKENARYSVFD